MTMVRCIWCPECVAKLEIPDDPYRRDLMTVRTGGLVGAHPMLCDRCNKRLPIGALAAGVSMYDNDSDYRPWEEEFLLFDEEEDDPPE